MAAYNTGVNRQQAYLRILLVPAIIIASFFIFGLVYRSLGLPEADEFMRLARQYYAEYGYWVVFFGALAEGLLFLNWYLPGSAVAVLGVVFARETGQSVLWVLALIMIGFLITSVLNYWLGKYGWYRLFLKLGLKKPLDETKKKLEAKGLPIIFSTYFHPNVGALIATSAGILQLDFKKFFYYSAVSLFLWGSFWGVIVYFFGSQLLEFGTIKVMVAILGLWTLYYIIKNIYQHELEEARS